MPLWWRPEVVGFVAVEEPGALPSGHRRELVVVGPAWMPHRSVVKAEESGVQYGRSLALMIRPG